MSRVPHAARAMVELIRGRARASGVVLAYHDVTAREAHGLSVTAPRLRAHIRLLRRLGLRIAPLAELDERLNSGRSCAGLAGLSFDDGLIGVHRHALAVLQEEKAPATVFAVSNALGVAPAWWPGSVRTMTRTELAEVVAAGVGVGAHTRTHPSLPSLADDALRAELRDCRIELEDLFGKPVAAVAYPSGHHDVRVRAAARAAGYRTGFTFLNGRLSGTENLYTLPRFTMTARHQPARLAYHLARRADSWPDHQRDVVDQNGA